MKNYFKNIDLKKIMLAYILVYFVISCLYCGIYGGIVWGEWDDYTYPLVTIMTQHRISVSESDLPVIKEYFPEWEGSIDYIGINGLSGRLTRDGRALAWYFPTYAIVCIPMICLLRFLKFPAVYTFCFTNLFAVISVLLVVYKWLKTDDRSKLSLILLLSVNPVVFYYWWPSSEAVIYSFLAIGLIFWYNKWHKRAAIFVSLAGTLNITIMSVGIIMISIYMICLLQTKSKDITWMSFIKKNMADVIQYGSCYIIGLIPVIYFYYHTGYINLTASYEGFLVGTETTMQRFLAYLFDLNFGFLPYYPVILILGFILSVAAIIKRHWDYMVWFAAFIVNVVLYSVQIHINCGMSGMARYNTWGILLLVLPVYLFSNEIVGRAVFKKVLQTGIWINVAILLLIVHNCGPTLTDKMSYVSWTPIAEFALDHFPAVYNPLHSTFNSRTNHVDGGYHYETPVVYTAEDGYVRKILASENSVDCLRNSYVSEYDNEWLNHEINLLGMKDTYISVPEKYKVSRCETYTLGDELLFYGEYYNAKPYIVTGLSETEEWGTWTLGNEFCMRFKVNSENGFLHGCIDCGIFNKEQGYTIYVNDRKTAEGTATGEKIEFNFANPGSGNAINLKIHLPDACSPESLGEGESDLRVIALGIRSIKFTEGKED